MDSIIPPVLLSLVSLLNNVASSARNALEIAKKSGNTDLKAAISELYDDILDVKGRVLELDEENRVLRADLAKKGSITYSSELGYYFVAGDPNPYCPTCYDANEKLLHLTASEPWNGGQRRNCRVCRHTYWDKPQNHSCPDPSAVEDKGWWS